MNAPHLIDGRWSAGRGSGHEDVVDPATGEVLARYAVASPDQVGGAVAASARSHAGWRTVAPADRGALLARASDGLLGDVEQIARTITGEMGKPLEQARAEVRYAAAVMRWNGEEAARLRGRAVETRGPWHRASVTYEPVGPVAAISGWNAPLLTPTRKVSGALAAGCSVVLKASERAPGPALALCRALAGAGLPPGAVNLVLGDPAGFARAVVASEDVRCLTFTGSTAVGRRLAAAAAGAMKRSVMELGGHAPVIVLADADVEETARSAVAAAMRNSGQVCTSPSRLYLDRSIFARFVEAAREAAGALRVGDPMDPATDVGPLANGSRIPWMEGLVADARSKGLRIVAGGERIGTDGFYWAPTLVEDPDERSRAAVEEPFGPLAVLVPVDSPAEAVARANGQGSGLAAYVFGRDPSALRSCAEGLYAGAVAVNSWAVSAAETPFGGRGASGSGAEGGPEGLLAFLDHKFVGEG